MSCPPQVLQPRSYRRSLFPHQLTSIYRMEHLERTKSVDIQSRYHINTLLGIQADITGYGKTASMVGLLVRDEMEWVVEDPDSEYEKKEVHSYDGLVEVTRAARYKKSETNLIVASQSIVSQWIAELKESELSVELVKTRRQVDTVELDRLDVLVCTPTMFNRLARRFSNTSWKRFIYDEPGTCHIPSMLPVTAGFTWFVTATPDQVKWRYAGRNTSHYIASMLLGQLENVFFQALTIRNPVDYVTASWAMPRTLHSTYCCFQPVSRTMRGLVPQQVATMIEGENIRGAIAFLGGSESDSIVEVVKQRFEEEISEARHKIDRYRRRGDLASVTHWTRKLERAASRITQLEARFAAALESACNICLDKIQGPVLLPCCQNLFCGKCMLRWLQMHGNCPLCRAPTTGESLVYITDRSDVDQDEDSLLPKRALTKPEQIVNIIQGKQEIKVIIFSEEDATFQVIKQKLDEAGIKCHEIKGRAETRERLIGEFKDGPVGVLFLNSKNNGAGINLQECTDIILYHKMGEPVQTQIIGRANRIGRLSDLHVHHLVVQCGQT